MSNDLSPKGLDLSALIGSRICHDLISPIGAIGNGVELLTMSNGGIGPELSLISDSVANANARIRFFRIAFGQAARDQAVGRAEVMSVLRDVYGRGRLTVDWKVGMDASRAETKAAFLALQCLETAMPFGGAITIERPAGQWKITGNGQKLKVDPVIWDVLDGGDAGALTPALVHFALLPDTLGHAGRALTVRRGDTHIQIEF